MINYSIYKIDKSASVRDALIKLDILSSNNAELTLLVMDEKRIVGTLTDGDIRRYLIKHDSINTSVEKLMETNFKYIIFGNNNIKIIKKYRQLGLRLLPCINQSNELIRIFDFKNKISCLPVDAILMAGGKGERLRPLTENTPKPLLKVGRKAIIDYNVDNLINYGVENIHVTTNYLAVQIEDHFKEERQGVKIKCFREKEYLGTIASAKLIPDTFNNDIIIMNSDLFTNVDFEDFYLHFSESEADMSIAAIPYSINIPYGIFELEGRNIQGIKEKPTYNYYANAGIYIIKKKLLELIPNGMFYNATDFIELLVLKNKKIVNYPLTGYWIDIGKHIDYQKAQELAEHIE